MNHFEQILSFFEKKNLCTPGDRDYNVNFCNELLKASGAKEASIWEQHGDGRLFIRYGTNVLPAHAEDFYLCEGEGITGAVALGRRAISISKAGEHPGHHDVLDKKINFETRSMISAPIQFNGILFGVLNIINHESGRDFPFDWRAKLSAVAVLYAMALATCGRLNEKKQNRVAWKSDKASLPAKQTSIVGISDDILSVIDLAVKAGKSDIPVIIYGETGTGKELAARKIHESGLLRDKPFIAVNCAALPETLLESELFGHIKGAFSGADHNRKGKFMEAAGGTLFLDEIAEMSLSSQAKILRVLQEKKVAQLGSEKEIQCNVRIIAATNQDLQAFMTENKFRKDLYYRLCGMEINIPALRHRKNDLDLLVKYFLRKATFPSELKRVNQDIPEISEDALNMLYLYDWPGNVRQLEQAIFASLAVCNDHHIKPADLPQWFHQDLLKQKSNPFMINKNGSMNNEHNGIENLLDQKNRFLEVLEKTKYSGTGRWNISAAAKELGIKRKTFFYRIKKMQEKGLL
ncbi:MAG: sigma 54-interacting transcriptional regulator [Desulfobacteraceae bacterium]|jgi:transcriptional regulator with PAS, ATPase and Fis domain